MSDSSTKLFTILLSALLLGGAMGGISYHSDGAYGEDGIGYSLNHSTGTLTIEGVGTIEERFADHSGFEMLDILSVTICEGITGIGKSVFEGCTEIVTVRLPSSLESIGEAAFFGCESLRNISIPENVSSIGKYAFTYCTSLKDLTVPEGVTVLDGNVFTGCTALESVSLPDSLESIGDNAFSGCSMLKDVGDPDSLTEIGMQAFSGCSSLEYIDLPDTVTRIGAAAFAGCSSLKVIDVPDGVTEIVGGTYNKCTSAESIFIPGGVTVIGANAFSGCSSVGYVEFMSEQAPVMGEGAFRLFTFDTESTATVYTKGWGSDSVFDGDVRNIYTHMRYVTHHTVTFDSNGGSEVAAQSVLTDSRVSVPSEPTKGGHTFQGWFTDVGCTIPYDWDLPITCNTILYAGWQQTTLEITAPNTIYGLLGDPIDFIAAVTPYEDSVVIVAEGVPDGLEVQVNGSTVRCVATTDGMFTFTLRAESEVYAGTSMVVQVTFIMTENYGNDPVSGFTVGG